MASKNRTQKEEIMDHRYSNEEYYEIQKIKNEFADFFDNKTKHHTIKDFTQLRRNINTIFEKVYFDEIDTISMLLSYSPVGFLNKLKLKENMVLKVNEKNRHNYMLLAFSHYIDELKGILKPEVINKYWGEIYGLFFTMSIKTINVTGTTIINKKEIVKMIKETYKFLRVFIDRNNYKIIPNKKYDYIMFDRYFDLRFKGYKSYVAAEEVLKEFNKDISKAESFMKIAKKHINRKFFTSD